MRNYAAQLWLIAALAGSLVVSWFSDRLDPYFLRVIMTIGINIILAVSLNLVNGYTGQFSLGHAGFMCVGAYTSTAITMFGAPKMLGTGTPDLAVSSLIFVAALLLAGLLAAVS